MERELSETNVTQDPNTSGTVSSTEETTKVEGERLSYGSAVALTLALLGCILLTLSIIIAGYFHGHMSIKAVYHSITNFS